MIALERLLPRRAAILPLCLLLSQTGYGKADAPACIGNSGVSCPAESVSETFLVKKVFDGDTILLHDGRKIRLSGINTPEVAGNDKLEEPGGEQAKIWLKQRLEHRYVRLQTDVETHDKYGRTLAFVFDEEQRNLNLELVENGLATVSIFPPNLKYSGPLLAAQRSAERKYAGLWSYPQYAPQSFLSLNQRNYRGWKRITGQIRTVRRTRKNSYLQFSDLVALRIDNRNAGLFPAMDSFPGLRVEVRGWPVKTKNRFVIPVRHPGQIKILIP